VLAVFWPAARRFVVALPVALAPELPTERASASAVAVAGEATADGSDRDGFEPADGADVVEVADVVAVADGTFEAFGAVPDIGFAAVFDFAIAALDLAGPAAS
jgi:hypothetical protein